jgi:AcrR family transcriptional regulator
VIRDFRRDQVIVAARALFEERATLDVSMGDIAERAGVSRSTLYNHFTTRDDVLVACLAAGQTQLVDAIDSAVKSSSGSIPKLAALVGECVAHVDRSPVFFHLMAGRVGALRDPGDGSKVELSLTGMRVGAVIREVVEHGVESGDFDADVDEAIRLVGVVLTGLLQTRSSTTPTPAAELATQVVGLVDRGLRGGRR